MKIDIKEFASFLLSQGLSGEDTDLGIQTLTGEILENPMLGIEIFKTNEFITLTKDSKKYFIYQVGLQEFYFTALYEITETAPIPRGYFIRKKIHEVIPYIQSMKEQGFNFTVIHDEEFSKAIYETTFEARKRAYLDEKEKKLSYLKNHLDGRRSNTTLKGTMLLNSKHCLSCRDALADYQVSTTMATSDKSMMMLYNVCPKCLDLAKNFNGSNIEFLLNSLGVNNESFKSEEVSDEELFKRTVKFFKNNLKCKNITYTIKKGQYEISAFRKSGIKIIFRMQGANQKKISYAYMLYDKKNNSKQLVRYDSADHHNNKLTSAPDHIHYNLEENNNDVQSSFLTGFLDLDLPEIKRKIQELEQSYK
ncbi:hypothetical protein KKG72_00035 [bacterium]|nr:hypothetical protein [bacterium]MBU1993402.1 hypothetical protein [bacterium]